MAVSSDARISTALPSHPKTKKLVKRLGGGAAWHLVCLFLWAAGNRPDGDLEGLSDEDIELAVDWLGTDGGFVNELVAVGFLDGEQGARRIHDWSEHNPWAAGADARKEKASFAALVRQHGRAQAEQMMPAYAKRLRDARKQQEDNERGAPPEQGNDDPVAGNATANSKPAAVPDGASSSATSKIEDCPVSVTDSVSVSVSDSVTEKQKHQGAPAGAGTPTRSDPIPYQAIVDAYNGTMTGLAKVRELTDDRRLMIRRAWNSSPARKKLRFWVAYFGECQISDFYNGTGPYREQNAKWRPDFEFLVKIKTVNKVYELAMDRRERERAAPAEQPALVLQ